MGVRELAVVDTRGREPRGTDRATASGRPPPPWRYVASNVPATPAESERSTTTGPRPWRTSTPVPVAVRTRGERVESAPGSANWIGQVPNRPSVPRRSAMAAGTDQGPGARLHRTRGGRSLTPLLSRLAGRIEPTAKEGRAVEVRGLEVPVESTARRRGYQSAREDTRTGPEAVVPAEVPVSTTARRRGGGASSMRGPTEAFEDLSGSHWEGGRHRGGRFAAPGGRRRLRRESLAEAGSHRVGSRSAVAGGEREGSEEEGGAGHGGRDSGQCRGADALEVRSMPAAWSQGSRAQPPVSPPNAKVRVEPSGRDGR